jgi:predicted helicase
MTTQDYITSLNNRYKRGNATEHTYRGDLQLLLESLIPGIEVTNEPQRQACGAPDYVVSRKDIPLGFIEAKNINDDDLEGKKDTGNKEQFVRYRSALNNLIITDYLNFHFYDNGELMTKVCIGTAENGVIVPDNEGIKTFELLFSEFCNYVGQTIKSPQKLALMMAGKAKLLANIINNALISDEENQQNSSLREQMLAFKEILIHDIKPAEFADVYAQTITYGLFAARLHDPTLEDFSRHEAAELIPKSNPFLRKLFGYIAGPDIDDRILWVVDNLIEVFLACNVEEVLQNYGKSTKMEDPIIHFYETFLSEYNPKLRKARGVWYTPQPVVDFIVRAVDDILKDEFGLKAGLADTSKTKIKVNTDNRDKRSVSGYKTVEKEIHKVQILDPATGTGTFLAEVIKHIHKRFKGQAGIWNSYVQEHLIPRLNGFELLMASYAMAHLKLDLLLRETGYTQKTNDRLRVYLTNSLEESHPDTGTLLANWLSSEANEANRIKRDSPVMCVIGNPPYNRTSNNASKFIVKLLDDYRKDLNERNLVPLDDDYIKFIKYGQHYIDKNGEGILAYISSNSFVDGVTHRQMRKNLLETFDKVYILNLHGNVKKREKCPDGSTDQNVFDIMTGVSINIFIKNNQNKKKFGDVLQYDLYGKRDVKYSYLKNSEIKNIDWSKLELKTNFEPWIKFDSSLVKYDKYLLVTDIFNAHTPCVRTHKDKELVSFSRFDTETNQKYLFKAFDNRFVDFDLKKIGRPRVKVMHNMMHSENISLIYQRGCSSEFPHTPFISKLISDQGAVRPGTTSTSTMSPLYTYPIKEDGIFKDEKRKPNLNQEIVSQIAKKIDLTFTNEKEQTNNTFAPIDILDYIYAVLHSPSYREKYKEFLKIDFPRVPYPKNQEGFWQLVKLGGEIRNLHLLESETVEDYITQYPIQGSNEVVKPIFKDCRVHINDEQYFDNVPQLAWEFYIGGYQPAQKWLKDRKGRELSFEDIMHYQKIVVSLTETDRLMKEIDKVIDLN